METQHFLKTLLALSSLQVLCGNGSFGSFGLAIILVQRAWIIHRSCAIMSQLALDLNRGDLDRSVCLVRRSDWDALEEL
jgi:hypothetical protein